MCWYGFLARLDAIFHKLFYPWHRVLWVTVADELCLNGDITCETCGVVYWCRALEDGDLM